MKLMRLFKRGSPNGRATRCTSLPPSLENPPAHHAPLHRSAAWRIVGLYAHQLGLQRISPHAFRRFVATELARKDIRKAQLALGHQHIETTASRHYVFEDVPPGLTEGMF